MKNNPGWFLLAGAVVLGLCGTCVCLGVMAYGFFALAESTVTSEGEFRGYYTSGFEVSSFVACDQAGTTDPGYGEGWWLEAEPESGFYEQYNALSSQVSPPPGGYVTVFVRFRGRLSPPGSYGHLGAYARTVTVQEVVELSLEGTCDG
jgi:hypothetical protein